MNKTVEPRLALELIPNAQASQNLRFALVWDDWKELSRRIVKSAMGVCQICGISTDKLECHESWRWDDAARTQTLVGLVAICRICHQTKHMHQHEWIGVEYDDAYAHLARVNGWTGKQTKTYVKRELAKRASRALRSYEMDLSYVRQLGLATRPFYESLHLGQEQGDKIQSLAKLASKEIRRHEWVAIFRDDHAQFVLCTVEPCTNSAEEVALLISSFRQMRHCHGTLVGLYDAGTSEEGILADLTASIERRRKGRQPTV